jgi:hypothetical protein
LSHPLDMSLSLTGWSIEPDMLDDIRIELLHSDTTGDELRIKLMFKAGREALINTDVDKEAAHALFEQLQQEMSRGSR